MKNTMRLLVLVSLLASFSACVETTMPLCNQSNKLDVPNFAKSYTSTVLDSDFNLSNTKMLIQKAGTGMYSITTNGQVSPVSTCTLGSKTIAEFSTEYGTFQQYVLNVNDQNTNTLSFSMLVTGQQDLNNAGLKFSIEERSASKVPRAFHSAFGLREDGKNKVLIIKNENAQDNHALSLIAVSSLLGLTFY
ncbi:MAG: hypothetical protein ACK5WZ_04380 [Pseudobdellovibrionaceae bacterium]